MGERGPKPKPATVHLLNGNPGKKNVGGLIQKLQRPVGLPECPPDLSEDARLEWGRLGVLLEQLGLISELDMAAFALYCESWSDFQRACRKLKELGEKGYVMETPSGYQQIGPWLSIKNNAAANVNKYKQEFGLSPADWTRVDANPQGDLFGNGQEQVKDTAARFLR